MLHIRRRERSAAALVGQRRSVGWDRGSPSRADGGHV